MATSSDVFGSSYNGVKFVHDPLENASLWAKLRFELKNRGIEKRVFKYQNSLYDYQNTSAWHFIKRARLRNKMKRLEEKIEVAREKQEKIVQANTKEAIEKKNDENVLKQRDKVNKKFEKSNPSFSNPAVDFSKPAWKAILANPTKGTGAMIQQPDGSFRECTNLDMVLSQIQKNPMTITSLPEEFITKHPALKSQIISSWKEGMQNGDPSKLLDPQTGRRVEKDEAIKVCGAYMRGIGRRQKEANDAQKASSAQYDQETKTW